MRRGSLHVSLLLLLALGAVAPPARAQPAAQAGTGTLSILGGQVQVQAPGASSFAAASDGQTVGVGARIRTGADGRAVLTFFDGTTATLDPSTEISLDQVQPSGEQQGGLLVGVGLAVGRVWTQVTSLVNRGSSFEVQAGSATAVAREGVTGYRKDPDGTVACWDISGYPMKLKVAQGEIEVPAGHQVTLRPDQGLAPVVPRAFDPGLLEVRAKGAAVARLVTPTNQTVGFPLPELAVNQVFDATTSQPGDQDEWIQVPGPRPGLYRLLLQGMEAGPYEVAVKLELEGRELFALQWNAIARPNEQLVADLTVEASGNVPTAAFLDAVRPLAGPAPGNFIYP
jgi:hypothetical protein